ncbi:MAG: hypothetical protein WCG90_06260 [Chitinophagia bacterium]|jgi:hypothetical protein
MSPRSPLAFFSKVAVITNLIYLLSTLFLFITWMKIPRDIAQFISVMGLELAPFINILFVFILFIQVIQKKVINLPTWQTIFNLSMLMVQIGLLFI